MVSRYTTLKQSNERLKKSQRMSELTIEKLSDQLISYQKEQTMKTVSKGGSIANKQKELEQLDSEKEKIISSNEENSSAKMATTCEHG